MSLQFAPYAGQILKCDFSNLCDAEMNKVRPVLVVSPREERYKKPTCVIVALSTTAPTIIKDYHMVIKMPIPKPPKLDSYCWVKGDMVYSVSLQRLEMYWVDKRDGKRNYWNATIEKEELILARKCIANAIGYIS